MIDFICFGFHICMFVCCWCSLMFFALHEFWCKFRWRCLISVLLESYYFRFDVVCVIWCCLFLLVMLVVFDQCHLMLTDLVCYWTICIWFCLNSIFWFRSWKSWFVKCSWWVWTELFDLIVVVWIVFCLIVFGLS